jgi:alcohol dehydrogenase, propanol-preferring
MRAYRLLDWGRPPQVVDVPVPEPGPGELLVRVAGNGLCHSDLDMMQIPAEIGPLLGWDMPFTLGHEIAGWVERLGSGPFAIEPGAAVALVSPESCGTCDYCVRGRDSACHFGDAGRGYGRDGGLADYVLVRSERAVLPLGDLDPVAAAPLTDAGATAYHAVSRAAPRLPPGSSAIVIGAGGLGSFAVQFLRVLTPARVIAVDQNPSRLDLARELGVHETVEGTAGLAGRDPVDVVLDFVGTDDTIAAGMPLVRRGGVFGLVGAGGGRFRQPWFGGLPREAEVFTFQGSSIAHARAVVALAASGQVRSEVDRYSFADVETAYDALRSGTLRGRAVVELT